MKRRWFGLLAVLLACSEGEVDAQRDSGPEVVVPRRDGGPRDAGGEFCGDGVCVKPPRTAASRTTGLHASA
ncbi:MAG: hypothetical protein RIT81_25720 [Deltaproteobacteria bacterium]